jgi:hypothetical protein
LFWRDSNGLDPSIVFGASGLGFTLGGVAGLLALVLFLLHPVIRTPGAS